MYAEPTAVKEGRYKLIQIIGGIYMESTNTKEYNNEIVINTKYGNTIKIIFSENDNKDVENVVLDNLMTSYERRIGA